MSSQSFASILVVDQTPEQAFAAITNVGRSSLRVVGATRRCIATCL
jgi:hypothetical protein